MLTKKDVIKSVFSVFFLPYLLVRTSVPHLIVLFMLRCLSRCLTSLSVSVRFLTLRSLWLLRGRRLFFLSSTWGRVMWWKGLMMILAKQICKVNQVLLCCCTKNIFRLLWRKTIPCTWSHSSLEHTEMAESLSSPCWKLRHHYESLWWSSYEHSNNLLWSSWLRCCPQTWGWKLHGLFW